MDMQILRDRIISEVMRQLQTGGAAPAAPPAAAPATAAAPPAPAAVAPPPAPAAVVAPPAPAAPVRSPERAAELAALQAACPVQPDPAVPERVDVLVVLAGRDQVGDGLAGARELIHQGCSAALVTSPELLEATGPGLLYEVLAGGPAFCRPGAGLARRLARAARVVLVPWLDDDRARALIARTAGSDLAGQVLAEALSLKKPVIAAPAGGLALAPGNLAAVGVTLAAPDRLAAAALPHLGTTGSGAVAGAGAGAAAGIGAGSPPAAAVSGGIRPAADKVPAWAGYTIVGPWNRSRPAGADPDGPTPRPSGSYLLEQPAAPPVRVTVSGAGNPVMAHPAVQAPGTGVRAARAPAAQAPAAPAAPAAGRGTEAGAAAVDRELARHIDHTLLKPDATAQQIEKLCKEAVEYGFYSVCVNPAWVPLCAQQLKGTPVKVAAVIGFPLGATSTTAKALEARDAIAAGASELDMVINVGALKSGQLDAVLSDIRAVVQAAGRDAIVKVILETGLLTDEEKVRACELAKQAGAHFVKTSTGFGPGGATAEDIALMRRTVGSEMGVKASGGVRDAETARKLIAAGATRIGASASVAIVTAKPAGGKGKAY